MLSFAGSVLLVGTLTGVALGSVTPVVVGQHGSGSSIWGTRSISVDGGLVYGTFLNSGVDIFDVDLPESPELVGTVRPSVAGAYPLAWDVAASDGLAYVAIDSPFGGDSFHGIWIGDMSDPELPVSLGSIELPGNRDLVVLGEVLVTRSGVNGGFGSGESGGGFRVIDVSDPSAIEVMSEVVLSTTVMGLDAVGTDVYLADLENGLLVFDISDAHAPVEAGRVKSSGFAARDVVVEDGLAYVIGGDEVRVFDIQDPASMVQVGVFTIPDPMSIWFTDGLGKELAVVDGVMYVLNGEQMLVVDAVVPGAMALDGVLDLPGSILVDIAVEGDVVYLADETQGMLVVDVGGACGNSTDLNGDGALDFFDISIFLSTTPDLNEDGFFDFLDMSFFLSNYSVGCI